MHWDGRRHQMRRRVDSGLWEIFVPGLGDGAVYKYELLGADGALLPLKADPVRLRRRTAALDRVGRRRHRATSPGPTPNRWPSARAGRSAAQADVDLRGASRLLAARRGRTASSPTTNSPTQLIPYVADMGFTHIELLPVSEHPLDDSWGYQPIGLFAPTRRFGEPAGVRALRRSRHARGPRRDPRLGARRISRPIAHGLAHFDGTALYEHADPRKGFHPDWNTAIYNFGRTRGRQLS